MIYRIKNTEIKILSEILFGFSKVMIHNIKTIKLCLIISKVFSLMKINFLCNKKINCKYKLTILKNIAVSNFKTLKVSKKI